MAFQIEAWRIAILLMCIGAVLVLQASLDWLFEPEEKQEHEPGLIELFDDSPWQDNPWFDR